LAEQRSLIIPLGLLAFEQACKTLLGWKRKGFEALGSQFRLSINMAPPQFSTPNFIEEVENVLQAWHASPEDICIEITETSLMENQALAARRIAILKQMGCSIAIDDFGTGYSSLAYLQQFDVDIIKIDRSITKNVATCKSAQKIAQAIIQLGHSLDIQIVAEGVETPAQLTTLQNYGCDAIQGFIAGKPVPASDAEMWLNNPVFPIDIPAKNKLAAEKCCNE
jgi:EAL domain-containing protein (putative c-di-GMP-specific phosphodiesterase class I)